MAERHSAFRDFWRRFRAGGYGVGGAAMLGAILLVAVLAGHLVPYGPRELASIQLAPPGSPLHPLGTDQLGRDIMSELVYGTRVSLAVGVTSAFISGIVGTVVGATAGYFGGVTEQVLSKIVDAFLMIPTFFLILIVVALFGASLYREMLVIGLTIWPANARLMRAQVLSLRERTFVKAEHAIGKSDLAVLAQHVVPNAIHPIIANTTLQIAGAILTEAGLSFIGLGDPNLISWGQMIYAGRDVLTTAWWVSLFPGLAIVITVLAFYFVGDDLGVALNPKLQRRQAA